MTGMLNQRAGRRTFIGGSVLAASWALTGCTGMGGFGLTDAVRRLLYLSSERAFATLTAPDGYWDRQVAQVGLGTIMGTRGDLLSSILTSSLFKSQLEWAFSDLAIRGSERAAPLVTEAVRVAGFSAVEQLISGGPTAATSFLRGQMGNSLVEAMVPELGQAIRIGSDPVIGRAIAQLSGVDVPGVATRVSTTVNDAVWQQIGVEEAAIRANPQATGDPLLTGVFGVASRL